MSLTRRNRPSLQIASNGPKRNVIDQFDKDLTGGCLTPDLQPSQPKFPSKPTTNQGVYKIGRYVLEHQEGETYKACDYVTKQEKTCKVRPFSLFFFSSENPPQDSQIMQTTSLLIHDKMCLK